MNYWGKVINKSYGALDCWNRSEISNNGKDLISKEYEIKDEILNRILTISNEQNPVIYLLFLTSTAIMYKNYSGNEEYYTLGCHPLNINNQMIKILPLVDNISDDDTISETLNKVKNLYIELNQNSNIRTNEFREILNETFVDNKSYINASVVMENIYNGEIFLSGEELIFSINKQETIKVKITGKGSKYNETVLDRLFRHLEKVLETIVNEPNTKIKNINMLGKEEQNKIVYDYNNTCSKYRDNKTMIDIWEDTFNNHSEKSAIIYKDKKMTYKELEKRSNEVAGFLRSKGVTRNTIVGLMVNRSFEMLIGIFGIVKAGGAYMPILPTYPSDRVEYMIEDSKTTIVLSTKDFINDIPEGVEKIDINEIPINTQVQLEKINEPNDILYVIYTSGSTGKPKGVRTRHTAYINRIDWMINKYGINETDSIVQKTSYCFDVSVCELLILSFVGGTLCMLEQGDEMNPERILELINNNKITIVHFVPSMLNVYMQWIKDNEKKIEEMKSIRYVMCSGEALQATSVNEFYNEIIKDNNCKMIDLYGPTETAIEVTYFECKKGNKYDFIPIGKPISNVKAFVMNKELQPVAVGVPGELCIGGVAVSEGYLNKAELTNEKFVECDYAHGRIYKTGDLVRLLDNGNIEYISRIDNQVKIRGFRIELGEIETRLLEHEKINHAAVLVKNENGEDYICAYIVTNDHISIAELKRHIGKKLPSYMIPNYFMEVAELPITSNGKLDRKNLLSLKLINNKDEYVAPENEIEEKMVNIFKDILGVEQVGVIDSFFDLGGHSLKATVLMSKIYDEFKVTIPIKDIFICQTVRNLSKKVIEGMTNTNKNDLFIEIPKLPANKYYETSSAQKRIYTIQQIDPDSIAYNIPVSFILEGELNEDKIVDAFNKLLKRHESLRTSFKIVNEEIMQEVQEQCDFKIEKVQLSNDTIDKNFMDFIRPFNLEESPLIRVGIGNLSENKNIMFIDMHHIISDGVSINILISEFLKLYIGKELDEVNIDYKDYAKWSNDIKSKEIIANQEEYWINKYNNDIPVLNLPTDYSRTEVVNNNGKINKYKINKVLTKKIKKLCKENQVTEYMVLMSCLNILFNKYSGQNDIVIGSPIAGRRNISLQNIVGMFVNTLPIRTNIDEKTSYKDFLNTFKDTILEDFENQDYQFDDLVKKLNIKTEYGRNPLFDVMFSVENWSDNEFEIPGLKVIEQDRKESIAKFDLNLTATKCNEDIDFEIEYSEELYKNETIDVMFSHYEKILEQITTNINVLLGDIECITKKEKELVLNNFNNTISEYPSNKTIIDLFEEQVEKTPDKVAVKKDNEEISYRELNNKANAIAHKLREKGIKENDYCIIMCQRSIEMIIGIYGILKAGAAYVPVDPNYPKERIDYIFNDCKAKAIVIFNEGEIARNSIKSDMEIIDLTDKSVFIGDTKNPEKINTTDSTIYLIYTSGTTGNPKGASIKNGAFVNLVYWYKNEFELKDTDTVLMIASICFDLGQKNVFAPLICGGKLCVYDMSRLDYSEITQIIDNEKITWLNCAPSAFYPLVSENKNTKFKKIKSLNKVFLGGEPISYEKLKEWLEINNTEIINTYGPTECTDVVSYYRCTDKDYSENSSIPIGRALPNVNLYIVNNNKLCGIGVPGEVCIAGVGVSKGYLNNRTLTEEKFTNNIFGQGKMYHTGDLGKWLPDGNIMYMGRIDQQVKIHGIRIELDEIESAIRKESNVNDCAVIVREKNKEKNIYAYVVGDSAIDIKNLKNNIRKYLPEYMIPNYLMQIPKIPITTNGKLDRRALPDIVQQRTNEIIKPSNEKEEIVLKAFQNVLGIKEISVEDDFFELGGDSIKAIKLISKLKQLGIIATVKNAITERTVRKIALISTLKKKNKLFK